VRWRGWLVDVLLLAALVGLTAALWAGALVDLDVAVRDWVDAHRPPPADLVARILNLVAQGFVLLVLAVAAAAWLARRSGSVRPALVVVAAWLGLNVAIGLVKVVTDRAAPHLPVHAVHREQFFSGGLSYPSGHVANAVVWYGVLLLLLGAVLPAGVRWALRIAPPALAAVVNTYLAFHWLTDTIAGLLAGFLLDRALRRVDWNAVPLDGLARLGPAGRRLVALGWTRPVRELADTAHVGGALR
jgi:membrane-associated phospholipid phosphatase